MLIAIPRSTSEASKFGPLIACRKARHVFRRVYCPNKIAFNHRRFATEQKAKNSKRTMASISRNGLIGVTSVLLCGSLFYILNENGYIQPLPPTRLRSEIRAERQKLQAAREKMEKVAVQNVKNLAVLPFQDGQQSGIPVDNSAWGSFTSKVEDLRSFTSSFKDIQWASMPGSITDFVPEWAKLMPDSISKLQLELSMAPGSLADEIWQEAHDPYSNPETERAATVRVSDELCDEEKEFLQRRRKVTRTALAKYLGLPDEEVHPDDVPCIAMVGSGGGLRALSQVRDLSWPRLKLVCLTASPTLLVSVAVAGSKHYIIHPSGGREWINWSII